MLASSVVLSLSDGVYSGSVVSIDLSHATIDFPAEGPPTIHIGRSVDLTFAYPGMIRAIVLSAVVVGRARVDHVPRYTFQFRLSEGQEPSDIVTLFNRRAVFRAPTVTSTAVIAVPASGAESGAVEPIRADLWDIGANGISIVINPDHDVLFRDDELYVELTLPNSTVVLRLYGAIRYRMLMHSRAVRYGCEFDPRTPGFMHLADVIVGYVMKHQQQTMKYRGRAESKKE